MLIWPTQKICIVECGERTYRRTRQQKRSGCMQKMFRKLHCVQVSVCKYKKSPSQMGECLVLDEDLDITNISGVLPAITSPTRHCRSPAPTQAYLLGLTCKHQCGPGTPHSLVAIGRLLQSWEGSSKVNMPVLPVKRAMKSEMAEYKFERKKKQSWEANEDRMGEETAEGCVTLNSGFSSWCRNHSST